MSQPVPASPLNLPFPLTPLLGREREVGAVSQLFAQPYVRLVTLTGPGGVGKTRVGIQVVREIRDRFADRAAFVSLASIRDPDLVLPTITLALGLQDAGNQQPLERLQSYLCDREILLFLDNVEQVVAAAPQLAELLVTCPRLLMLVASRAVLRISGEYEYPITPLALPDLAHLPTLANLAQVPAVALFVQRAFAVMPTFQLDADNAAAVATLCVHLDGLPLAIELAAARSKLLPPQAMLARLTTTPGARLQLLRGGPLDLPARQHTLRDTIAWSYHLLTPQEQTLFRVLAVFVGGFTVEAAEGLASALIGHTVLPVPWPPSRTILDELARLLDQSLLIVMNTSGNHDNPHPRYTLLETIREYGLEQLTLRDELTIVQQAHLAYYRTLAAAAEPYLTGPDQGVWLERLETEHDNFRAALTWSLQQNDDAAALHLSSSLWWFWYRRGHWHEGRHWLQQALALSSADATATKLSEVQAERNHLQWRAIALNGAGILAFYQGDYGQATTSSGASAVIFRQLGDKRGLAGALHGLALVARLGDNHAAVRAMYGESLALYREVGDRSQTAYTLFYLGIAHWLEGNYESAEPIFQESLAIAQELRDRKAIAFAVFGLAHVALGQHDYSLARHYFGESLRENTLFGDQRSLTRINYGLGDTAIGEGDSAVAYAHYIQSLTGCQALGDGYFMLWNLEGIARVAAADGQLVRAVQLFAASTALRESMGMSQPPLRRATYNHLLQMLRTELDEATFANAWTAGQALDLARAVQYALTQPFSVAQTDPVQTVASPLPSIRHNNSNLPDSLTTRELEVLRLIATGMTDAEAAAALVISRRTVNAHLRSIYSKLGVTSRSGATRYALDQGLV